jgi:L-seryl-tRNA(Ser) seleniumtransferase
VKVDSKADLYRQLPSVDELIRRVPRLVSEEGQPAVTNAARVLVANLRDEITTGLLNQSNIDHALTAINSHLEAAVHQSIQYSLRPVVNATGVILHTNLGRAPLSSAALDHIRNTSAGYSNLEFDLETGARGKRDTHINKLFTQLLSACCAETNVGTAALGCPGEQSSPAFFPHVPVTKISTIVVNNNAAAVLLALNTVAEHAEVIVSRGELIEIGGSFRIPEIMAKSQAVLREVGTTNRTSLADYESAINERTKLLLRVHRSNFEIKGFTEQPALQDLVGLSRRRNIPLMEDLGSGSLFDLRSIGIPDEPGVLDSLRVGVDVITYSGDKLLGGPQSGILSGSANLIAKMRANSLFRALRVDKLTYAALAASLQAYVKRDYDSIPVLRMMRLSKPEIAMRAEAVAQAMRSSEITVDLIDGESIIGGGAAPSVTLPTCLIAVTSANLSADEVADRLRSFDPPVISRLNEGRVLLDLRTVFPHQDSSIVNALAVLKKSRLDES